jgi:hypothetical protein
VTYRYGTASIEMLDIKERDYRHKPEALEPDGVRE